jgi:hypothetical protein
MGDSFQGLQLNLGKAEDDILFADLPFFHLAEYADWYGDDCIAVRAYNPVS